MGRKAKTRRDPYGAWLHYLRTSKKLTQQELSRVTGIPQRIFLPQTERHESPATDAPRRRHSDH